MLESIKTLFDFATSGFRVGQEYLRIIRRRRGKRRLLLEELKGNQDLLVMVVEEGTDHFKVVPNLATKKYDNLLGEDFDFHSISEKHIKGNAKIRNSDIGYFMGKGAGFLIEDIYDKIKQIKTRYEVDRDNPRIDWRRRIINLYKRLVLLIHHLRSQ